MQILLTVAYDGTDYAGWQRQDNAIAVQEVIENALFKLYKTPCSLRSASRTDAGVHAYGQRASFFIEKQNIPLEKLPIVINSYLTNDIAIKHACIVSDDFNPRFSIKKTYEYKIYNSKTPDPLNHRYCAYERKPLDISLMKEAYKYFFGEHDFSAFKATGGSAKTSIRQIYDGSIKKTDNIINLSITGNGFLYNMVRIIAGTLLYVGLKRIPPNEIPKIILSKDRKMAGKTMPPEGLALLEIFY